MKYFPLVWAALRRKPIRAGITFLSVTVAFTLFGLMIGLDATMERMAQRRAEAVTSSWAAGPGDDEPGGDLLINLGAGHPSGHGMLRLRLTLEGDRIVTADPVIGYVHRGAEKLFEARDYRQIIVLANRHDWLGAFASELGVVLAAERLAGIEVPPRGVWARTLLAELNRVLSHLAFLGSYPPELAGGAAGEDGPAGAAEARRPGLALGAKPALRRRRRGPGNCFSRSWRRSPVAGCTTCSTGSAG